MPGRHGSRSVTGPGFATMLSLSVAGGEEIATIRRRRGGRFQVIVHGKETGLVRRRGADRYDIESALCSLAAEGSVTAGRYSITCDGHSAGDGLTRDR
jgi:hypothetical protein